jgi:hypothetical protein
MFLVDALTYTQSSVANADESAMNLEGVDLFYSIGPGLCIMLEGNFRESPECELRQNGVLRSSRKKAPRFIAKNCMRDLI